MAASDHGNLGPLPTSYSTQQSTKTPECFGPKHHKPLGAEGHFQHWEGRPNAWLLVAMVIWVPPNLIRINNPPRSQKGLDQNTINHC